MKKKESAFSSFISPILVLVVVCFVVTFALAMAYVQTNAILQLNKKISDIFFDAISWHFLPQN